MTNVLIAGGTGLIGSRLSQLLTDKGYQVLHLSRNPGSNKAYPSYHWDPATGQIDDSALLQADYVINLAGAGIADARWTPARKQLIINSRVQGNQLLLSAFERLGQQPKAFLSGAAIGYYGDRGEQLLNEEDEPGEQGFLPESCIAWEESIKAIGNTDIRTIAIRTGLVLSTQGGALEKMLLPLLTLTSTYFGNGQQWYSWIHIDDLCRIFIFALEQDHLSGFFNGVAPNPVRNKTLARQLPKAKGIPALLIPAPVFALRLALGEMAETVLTSTKVSAEKIKKAGFEFKHPELKGALQHLFREEI